MQNRGGGFVAASSHASAAFSEMIRRKLMAELNQAEVENSDVASGEGSAATAEIAQNSGKNGKFQKWKKRWIKDWKRDWVVYVLFIPVFVFFLLFNYVPMVGVLMSFQDFKPGRGLWNSEWVGFQNFVDLFSNNDFIIAFRNTCVMALLNLTVGYAIPVILGLLLSQVRIKWFKRTAQTVSYMPYFVATVVVCSLLKNFLEPQGVITNIFVALGAPREDMLTNPKYFWAINTLANAWQGAGYGAIVFVAAIANINPDLHAAAAIDGAGRWNRMFHITIPSILPTIITMFTLQIGLVFVTGFDKVLLIYNESIYETADVLTTFTYRYGIANNQYGLASAAGLFQSLIATALLLISNKISALAAKTSLF